jgi:hypothetical protein
MPRYIHDERRLREIQAAVARAYDAETRIPVEWIEEYNELIAARKANT